jgi:hypothetical protein
VALPLQRLGNYLQRVQYWQARGLLERALVLAMSGSARRGFASLVSAVVGDLQNCWEAQAVKERAFGIRERVLGLTTATPPKG